jgi:hypothetical protein
MSETPIVTAFLLDRSLGNRGCVAHKFFVICTEPQQLGHHNQVRRGEEEEVNLSRFLRYDRSVFKLVVGGSNMLGLAPNLVKLFLN